MIKSERRITESTLKKDLNELAHSFIRELSTACKKMAIYGSDHPLARKAVGPPFLLLGQIFLYKRYVSMNVRRGELYFLNIALKENIFSCQVMQFLQILDVKAVLFDKTVRLEELTIFVDALVKRDTLYNPSYRLSEYLQKENIASIEVNSVRGFELFEDRQLYRGEIAGDYSVRRLALDQIGDDLKNVSRLLVAEDDLVPFGIDFESDIIKYLIPERVTGFSVDQFVRAIAEARATDCKAGADSCLALLALAESHPESEAIRSSLDNDLADTEQSDQVISIQHESRDRVEKLLADLFSPDYEAFDILEFADAFSRLLKTGQHAKANSIIADLMSRLRGESSRSRQMALSLLDGAVLATQSPRDDEVIDNAISLVIYHLDLGQETFEYSELIRLLFGRCLHANCFANMAVLSSALATHRKNHDGVTVYESLAVKKALEQINRPETIDILLDNLVVARHEKAGYLRTILCAIGSEEVALALSRIISHPDRQVRQYALKILADLGDPSLTIFGRMMADDNCFKRGEERQELPDAKWYIVRNTIFVLGTLGDERAVDALRLRLGDPDIRVRREIVCALEKIGGEKAVDLLSIFADDSSGEIRGAALIAIGLIGTAEAAPLVIDIATRNPGEALKAITALGKLGGEEATQYLAGLLKNEAELSRLSAGKISREDLRVAIIKVLVTIGGKTGIDGIQDYQDNMSKTQKIFFKNSPLNKAIKEALSKKQ